MIAFLPTSVSSIEQIGMGSGADQKHFVIADLIEQEPIRLDVTLPNAAPLA
jgi:hypothetical protein